MGFYKASSCFLLYFLLAVCTLRHCCGLGLEPNQLATLLIDASPRSAKKIPDTLFGIFFEEINHAGAGGLWAELVSNRGFEAGGPNTPSNIDPWSIIGNESSVILSTDRSSCFELNKVALKMEVVCDNEGPNTCPPGGVGIYNPGFWGMGHGFRQDLFEMLADLKPRFLRFPGGSYVEGSWLSNAFRWKATIGPWEERSGHFNDVWKYWTDDGLGYFEFLQLAEDLGAAPVWVFNSGISHNDEIDTLNISSFVKDLLDSIEFARGASSSTWGSVRAVMGHPEPFGLKYVAIGNQDCSRRNYIGNYKKFYSAIKAAYPDIRVITNCDASSGKSDHPADLYDLHVYTSAHSMISMAHHFDHAPRIGPKAFVSEYAVTGRDAGRGSLMAALAQAAFLIGLEINSDVVDMASNAPLLVNDNDWGFTPDAIVFNSWQQYGTPTYWMQQFFRESSGAVIYPIKVVSSSSNSLFASAIKWRCSEDEVYFRVKVVNTLGKAARVKISVAGLDASVNPLMSFKTVLTSVNPMDENSFSEPEKVTAKEMSFPSAATEMDVHLPAHSLTSLDLFLAPLTSAS